MNIKHFIHDIHHQELKFLQTIEDQKIQISIMKNNFNEIIREKEFLANSTRFEHNLVIEQKGLVYYLSLALATVTGLGASLGIITIMIKMKFCPIIYRLICSRKTSTNQSDRDAERNDHLNSITLSPRRNPYSDEIILRPPILPQRPAKFVHNSSSSRQNFEIPSNVAALAQQIYGQNNPNVLFENRQKQIQEGPSNYLNMKEITSNRQVIRKQTLQDQLNAQRSDVSDTSENTPREV